MTNSYTFSVKAKLDIKNLVKQSLNNFGELQTEKYISELKQFLQVLADSPEQGRTFIHSTTQNTYCYKRFSSHVIYYRLRKNDIFILRILHKRMIPERHL